MSVFRRVEGSERYAPVNAAGILRWFHHATRGPGVTYQPLTIEGSRRVQGQGTIPGEGFRDVEAALFRKSVETTMLAHNASAQSRSLELSSVAGAASPRTAEVMETPDLARPLDDHLVAVRTVEPALTVELPPYSVTRLVWS
jgi:hypothetical protein